METNNNKSTAAIIHLSTLSQYFIPFGNFIFPVILWSSLKDKSTYVDAQGKRAINFQLSLFMYSLVLALIAIPIFIVSVLNNVHFHTFSNDGDFQIDNFNMQNVTGIIAVALIAAFLFISLKVFEFFLVIYASVKASNGEDFKYPLTINFLK